MFDKKNRALVVLFLCLSFITPMGIVGAQGMAKSDQNSPLALQTPKFAYVGSFTTADRDGRGTGIEVFSIDAKSGVWTRIQSVECFNPGFLTMDRQKEVLYVAHGGGTVVSAYAINQESGELTLINQQSEDGDRKSTRLNSSH